MSHKVLWNKDCWSGYRFNCDNWAASLVRADKTHGTHVNEKSFIENGRVPLPEGLYALSFPVTTDSPQAREYFNQGLVLTYGFDHSDAEVSFLEAAKHDPDMAMAYWGVAFVRGPNINASMDPANGPRAYEMVQKALSLAENSSEKEQDLIKALGKRYSPDHVEDRTFLDKAFAEAMERVYQKYPHDPDITVLYAESLMDLHPWDYWTADDQARPWAPVLQGVMEDDFGRADAGRRSHLSTRHAALRPGNGSGKNRRSVRSAERAGGPQASEPIPSSRIGGCLGD